MRPICVPCQRFYRCKKTGIFFIEAMPAEGHPQPGAAEAEKWTPYKLWSGDLYECKGCGAQLISGTGQQPIAEHYQKDFAEQVKSYDATIQINDC